MNERQQRIDQLRSKLTQRHSELTSRIEAITDDLRQKEPRSDDWDDRAKESDNDEVLEHLDDLGRAEVARIELALERMKRGDYGICAECGAEISINRLEAVPSAIYCIECARRRELIAHPP